MKAPNTSTPHTSLLLIFCLAVLVSACSGSSGGSDVNAGSNSDDSDFDINVDTIPSDDDRQDDNDININLGAQGADTDDTPSSTLVTFDVTVPQYVSQALQVKIDWGADDTLASWVVDESWTATGNLQAGSSYAITATFSDDNGAIVLGRAHLTLNTSTDLTQTLDIAASDFDTQSVDDDGDGVSNLAELNAGTHPLQPSAVNTGEVPPVVDARVELIADKTFRIKWESTPSATYYRVLENVDGSSGYTAVSDELGATVERFDHRVALYRRANARYMVEACNVNGCSYSVQQLIESLEGHMEEGVGYFKSGTPARSNEFGVSVSVSADGQTLAIGEDGGGIIDNDPTQKAGAVYIFQRANDEWVTEQVLLADRGDHGDGFGYRLELSADGNTLVVGAPGEDSTATGVNGNAADNSSDSSGAAYVFVRSGGQWQQQAYLKASNTPTVDVPSIGFEDRFGTAVSIGGDGRTVVVGASGEDGGSTGINGDESDNSEPYSGAAYVFVVNNGVWSQQAYLKASTTSGLRTFGHEVKLNADGNTLAVSAYNPYTDPTTPVTLRGANYDTFFGAVYVFTRSDSAWQQQALLRPSADKFDWHRFGDAIDLSDDGNTLVANGNNGVYLLERQGTTWQPLQLLVQSNPETDSNWYSSPAFGHALAISGDGSTVAISWPEESSAATGVQGYQGFPSVSNGFRNSGAAYLFEKLDGRWQQFSYLKAPNSRESLEFGSAISLDSTGDTLAISAINENSSSAGIQGDQGEDTLYGAGAVYMY